MLISLVEIGYCMILVWCNRWLLLEKKAWLLSSCWSTKAFLISGRLQGVDWKSSISRFFNYTPYDGDESFVLMDQQERSLHQKNRRKTSTRRNSFPNVVQSIADIPAGFIDRKWSYLRSNVNSSVNFMPKVVSVWLKLLWRKMVMNQISCSRKSSLNT